MTYPPPPQDGWPGQQPQQPDPYAQNIPGQPYFPQPGQEQPGYPPAPTAPMSGIPASGQPFHGQPGYGEQPPYADPYQSGQPMSGIPASGQPWPGAPMPQPQSGGSTKWILSIGAVVVVLALAVGTFLYINSGDDKAPVADPSESASPSSEPSEGPSLDPNAAVLTDPSTGLSYAEIGTPWRAPSANFNMPGFKSVTGEVLATEEFEDGASWIATFVVGEIDVREVGFDGADSLQSAAEAMAEMTDNNNYHAPPDWTQNLKGLKRDTEPVIETITIGQYTGISYSYHLAWDDDGIKETGESVAIGIIDLGDGRAAGFSMSLPDSAADEQQSVFAEAISSFHFV